METDRLRRTESQRPDCQLTVGNNFSYITVLSTDSYVEGVIVLHRSLMQSGTTYPFLVLTTPNLADRTFQLLNRHGIAYRPIPPIVLDTALPSHQARWQATYSKLQIFNQIQFDKLVYLDADMLVYQNLDELFSQPHMAAVNAGGRLPEYASWTEFNSGLMVIEPSWQLYEDMLAKLPELYLPAGGDQDFLNAYYPDWPRQPEKHLDHAYNIFHEHVDRYQQLYGYELSSGANGKRDWGSVDRKAIKVIHFVGERKPWLIKDALIQAQKPSLQTATNQIKATSRIVLRLLRKRLPDRLKQRMPRAIGDRLQQQTLQHWLRVYQAS
jgi:glycogenin